MLTRFPLVSGISFLFTFSTVVLLQSFDPAWTALGASKLSDLRLGSLKSVLIASAW